MPSASDSGDSEEDSKLTQADHACYFGRDANVRYCVILGDPEEKPRISPMDEKTQTQAWKGSARLQEEGHYHAVPCHEGRAVALSLKTSA